MNVALWIVQGLLAAMFLMAGFMKSTKSKEELAGRMAWVNDFSAGAVKTIGILEILGAIGLILPLATGILPWLTPAAAVGLGLTMIGAAVTHIRRSEFSAIGINLVLFLLAAFVAYGRF
ncbi:MAG: DoxX family protein [Ardenticatenaceae bacterium]|nr:DoxX family protein [Ardenticatenaceae bacterium]